MLRVSVIVPCFNHGAVLARAVNSALRQSEVLEVLIVDDGSIDDSLDVARTLAKSDSRVSVLCPGRNGGPAFARNHGARAARADYLSFLDADDELLDGFLGEALAQLTVDAAMAMTKSDVEFFDPTKGYVLPDIDIRYKAVVLSGAWGAVIRRSAFFRLGGFPEDEVFRGPNGGEDVAFMQAVVKYLQPIGRVARPGYRLWSQDGSHLDRFLGRTRMAEEGFEFVSLDEDQKPGGKLATGLERYLADVAERVRGTQ